MGNQTSGSGTYYLSGGSLAVGNVGEYIGDNGIGSFNQTAGTNSSTGQVAVGNNAGSNGSGNLGGSGYVVVPNLFVRPFEHGHLHADRRRHSVSSSLNLGYNSGSSSTYNLSGGSLAASYVTIGNSASGAFTHSGGTNSVAGTMFLAYNGNSSGSYNLSGSECLTAPTEYIGFMGRGGRSHKQAAQTIFTSNAWLGYYVGSSGSRYNLGGGSLSDARHHPNRQRRHRQLHAVGRNGRNQFNVWQVLLGDKRQRIVPYDRRDAFHLGRGPSDLTPAAAFLHSPAAFIWWRTPESIGYEGNAAYNLSGGRVALKSRTRLWDLLPLVAPSSRKAVART